MNRRRRLAILAAAVLASLAGSGVAASALPGAPSVTATPNSGENSHGDWLCVHVDTVELTYCQGDPLPAELIPDTSSL